MATANPGPTPPPAPAPLPKQDRTWLYVAVGFLVCWGLLLSVVGFPDLTVESPIDASLPTRDADFSWHLLDLNDENVEFSKFRGKTIFLNIWATWCGPCVKEMPSIARLASEPSLKDVVFLCVSTEESSQPIRSFIEGKHFPMTMLKATGAPDVFASDGIPATFIISPEGKIVSTTFGGTEWDRPEVIEFLRKQAEPPKPSAVLKQVKQAG